jgi:transposase-like protein
MRPSSTASLPWRPIDSEFHTIRNCNANEESCLRLIRSLAVETHENWLEANRYLNMNDLKEMKKADLRQAA